MNKSGPILVIEDDEDDRDFILAAFSELHCPNDVLFFPDGGAALAYLKQGGIHPFLIFCDINLPKTDGFEVKQALQGDPGLADKGVPFLYFTTSASDRDIRAAFRLSAQGFFVKPPSYYVLVKMIKTILEYWQMCCAAR